MIVTYYLHSKNTHDLKDMKLEKGERGEGAVQRRYEGHCIIHYVKIP
jgi:hypothetical protein